MVEVTLCSEAEPWAERGSQHLELPRETESPTPRLSDAAKPCNASCRLRVVKQSFVMTARGRRRRGRADTHSYQNVVATTDETAHRQGGAVRRG
jgi:hypothetical protein